MNCAGHKMLNKFREDKLELTQKKAVLVYFNVRKLGIYLENDKPEYEAMNIIIHDFWFLLGYLLKVTELNHSERGLSLGVRGSARVPESQFDYFSNIKLNFN